MLIKPSEPKKDNNKLLHHVAKDLHKHSSFRNKQPKPMLVISYDDGLLTDYTLAFDVHKEYNVPGELSITSGTINGGPSPFVRERMTVEQIKEMQDFGFEVVGHGKMHRRLGAASLRSGASAGDTTIEASQNWDIYDGWELPVKLHLWDRSNGIKEDVTVVSYEGRTLELSEPLRRGFNVWHTFLSVHEDELEREIKGCFDDLREAGIPAIHYSYPYNASSWYSRKIIRKYFNSGRTGDGVGGNIILPNETDEPLNSYLIPSYPELANKTDRSYIDNVLDSIVADNALAFSFEHSWTNAFDVETLAYIFEQCEQKGIEITTRSEAFEHYGNLLEIGDYTEAGVYDNKQDYFIVDKFGKSFTNMQ